MNVKEACEKLKTLPGRVHLLECLDFEDFWAFLFVDRKAAEDDMVGGAYDTVNKTTGEISVFNPTDNLAAFMASEPLPLEQFS